MVTLQFGLLSISLLIANSLGAPQQRQDVSRSQDPLNCNDLDVYGFHCVPIFQCSNEGIIKTDARGLFDPRYLENLLLMFRKKNKLTTPQVNRGQLRGLRLLERGVLPTGETEGVEQLMLGLPRRLLPPPQQHRAVLACQPQ